MNRIECAMDNCHNDAKTSDIICESCDTSLAIIDAKAMVVYNIKLLVKLGALSGYEASKILSTVN